MTMPNGQIYKIQWTGFYGDRHDAAGSRELPGAGILINTFMLARDRALVEFVKRVSEISKGKRTSPIP